MGLTRDLNEDRHLYRGWKIYLFSLVLALADGLGLLSPLAHALAHGLVDHKQQQQRQQRRLQPVWEQHIEQHLRMHQNFQT